MRYLAVILLIVSAGSPAFAQKTIADGNSLDDACRYERQVADGVKLSNPEEVGKASFCIGYVRGVLDEIWAEQNVPSKIGAKLSAPSRICIDDISNEQAMKVATKYLNDNPAKLQLPANLLIRASMEEAFPCKSP